MTRDVVVAPHVSPTSGQPAIATPTIRSTAPIGTSSGWSIRPACPGGCSRGRLPRELGPGDYPPLLAGWHTSATLELLNGIDLVFEELTSRSQ